MGISDEIGLVVGIGPVVGIGLFGGTGLVVSLTNIILMIVLMTNLIHNIRVTINRKNKDLKLQN